MKHDTPIDEATVSQMVAGGSVFCFGLMLITVLIALL